jgi:peptidoglycan hydrolase CwlO-like protein
MTAFTFKLIVFLVLAAVVGFATAWRLRTVQEEEDRAAQDAQLQDAQRRALLAQNELTARDKRIGILESDLKEEKKRFAELFADYRRSDQALATLREQAVPTAPNGKLRMRRPKKRVGVQQTTL